jgi:AcrR family transcriptional regulator
MHDIAGAHAGFGVGTAYRRFANEEQIIDALVAERLDDIAALATRALEDPDARHGLISFLEWFLRLQLEDRGLMEILNNPQHADRLDVVNERSAPLITAIIRPRPRQRQAPARLRGQRRHLHPTRADSPHRPHARSRPDALPPLPDDAP